jgi:hypothetical protein
MFVTLETDILTLNVGDIRVIPYTADDDEDDDSEDENTNEEHNNDNELVS